MIYEVHEVIIDQYIKLIGEKIYFKGRTIIECCNWIEKYGGNSRYCLVERFDFNDR